MGYVVRNLGSERRSRAAKKDGVPNGRSNGRFRRLRSKVLRAVAQLCTLSEAEDDVEQTAKEFAGYLVQTSRRMRRRAAGIPSDLHDPGHGIALWLNDPKATDQYGHPLPLPERGETLSVESFLKRANPRLRVELVLPVLLRNGTLRRAGRLYIPSRTFVLHNKETLLNHQMLSMSQIVENFEHQQSLRRGRISWPQRVADCPDFPASRLPAYIKEVTGRVKEFTESESDTMLRQALNAPRNARRVRPSLHVIFSVSNVPAARRKRKR